MKRVKAFDFYLKICVDNVTRPSIIGAIMSILSTTLIIYLTLLELYHYYYPEVIKYPIVYHSYSQHPIKVRLGLELYDIPCPLVSVDKEDLSGSHTMDIKEHITRTRLSRDKKIIEGNFSPYKSDLLMKALDDKESCVLDAYVEIAQSPGDIHVSLHNYSEVWEFLEKKSARNRIGMNHRLILLDFDQVDKHILDTFGLSSNSSDLPQYKLEHNQYSYEYYIKLIPHIIYYNSREYIYYQYSLSHTFRLKESEEEMPMIMINYNFSPIAMRYEMNSKGISRSIVHVCAIVGGVFVMFRIITGVLVHLIDI